MTMTHRIMCDGHGSWEGGERHLEDLELLVNLTAGGLAQHISVVYIEVSAGGGLGQDVKLPCRRCARERSES